MYTQIYYIVISIIIIIISIIIVVVIVTHIVIANVFIIFLIVHLFMIIATTPKIICCGSGLLLTRTQAPSRYNDPGLSDEMACGKFDMADKHKLNVRRPTSKQVCYADYL